MKDTLRFRADGRLLLFTTFDLSAATGAVVLVLRRSAVNFILYLPAIFVQENRVLPFFRADISAVAVDAFLFAMKKPGGHAYITYIRGGRLCCVNQSAVFVHANMRLVAKMPCVPLFARMSLRIALFFPVFRRRREPQ